MVDKTKKLKSKLSSTPIEKSVEETSEKIIKTIIGPFSIDKRKLTLGQRTADGITKWAGSWIFIISFLMFIVIWMIANIYAWTQEWDPYPFILLNLVLSCLAAIQAPVILMSQNRASQKDRLRAEYDYKINRKSEKEIQELKRQLTRIEKRLK